MNEYQNKEWLWRKQIIDRIIDIESVLRELWEVISLTLAENIDGESFDYYQERKQGALEKLGGKIKKGKKGDTVMVDKNTGEIYEEKASNDISRTKKCSECAIYNDCKYADLNKLECAYITMDREASGGEKEVGRITGLSTPLNPSLEGVLNGKQDTNSKPPEPINYEMISIIFHNNLIKQQIAEFQADLDGLNENPGIPYSYEPLNKLKKKWEEKLK